MENFRRLRKSPCQRQDEMGGELFSLISACYGTNIALDSVFIWSDHDNGIFHSFWKVMFLLWPRTYILLRQSGKTSVEHSSCLDLEHVHFTFFPSMSTIQPG